MVPQKIGISAAAATLGARNKSVGATKSFNSEVNEAEARVFTTRRLKGVPQTSVPNVVTGSSPNFVRFTANSMNCAVLYIPLVVVAVGPTEKARVLFCNT